MTKIRQILSYDLGISHSCEKLLKISIIFAAYFVFLQFGYDVANGYLLILLVLKKFG